MNLVIDIGNTLTKLFVFDKEQTVFTSKFETNKSSDIEDIFVKYPQITSVILSSVSEIDKNLISSIENKAKKFIILDHFTKLPVKNLYKSPETLGKDRIAAIAGAFVLFPEQNVLVIDAGTAITFDFLNNNAEYVGGNISPGLNMRFNALNHFTSKLPLIEKTEEFPLIGQNTNEAIAAGVQNGIIFEIEAYIQKLMSKYNDLKVILTGGDTFFFAHKLKYPIFAEPFLVAIGLNRILQHNA